MWCRQAIYSRLWLMAVSRWLQTPTLPVFEAVVSKHMAITNALHCHNFKRSRTATAAACPDLETNSGTPRSLVFPSTREEIRTGNLSTLPMSTPVMSGSSLESQCMTDFQARKSSVVCSAVSLRKHLYSAWFLSSSHLKLYSHKQ